MPPVLVIIFWLWFGVSLVLLVRRRLQGSAARRREQHAMVRAATTVPATTDRELEGVPDAAPAPADAPAPAEPNVAEPPATAARPSPGDAIRRARPHADAEEADTPAGAPDAEFPSVTVPDDRPAPSLRELVNPPRTSVAQILAGISMPCDLVPLTGTDPSEDLAAATRVVFCTTGHAAGQVGLSLADELERIGMAVNGTGASSAMATNDVGCVELTIYANPETVNVGNAPAFPTAPSDSVVVEIKAR